MPNGQSIFDDLPDADGQQKKPEGEPPEQTDKEVEARRNLEKANKREDAKLVKLNEELAAKRKKAKELKAKLEKTEEEDEEEDEEPEDSASNLPVSDAVEKALKERDEKKRRDDLALEIRKVAKNRQEAEEMYAMALTLPPTTPELDARFAAERVQTLRENRRGFVTPSFGGGGGFSEMGSRADEIEGFSEERVKFLQGWGVSKEDIKKYKDGIDFSRVYPKVSVNNK